MKKTLALVLALMMCIGIFAACGEEKKPEVKDPVDNPPVDTPADPTDKPEDKPSEPTDKPEDKPTEPTTPVNPNATIAYFDKAEDWTLVIAKPGTSGDERVGVLAEPGKIVAGTYNTAGNQRKTTEYVFDFASLGLEGKSWEYLGARVELDLSDENNPKILNKIEKTCFCVQYTDLTFPTDTSVKLPNGVEFDLTNINYGMVRTNNLINEGGWYIPKWNDKTTVTSKESKLFTHEDFVMNYYIFIKCTYVSSRGSTVCDMVLDSDVDMNASETPDTPVTPDEPTTPEKPTTPAEIVDALYALEKGGKLEGEYTLTGKITSVDTPYSEQYKNITVTIAVEGKEDKPVVCYRIKGEGAEGLAVGDTITVTGELINYADSSETGKREFNANSVVSNIVKGEAPTTPVEPETPAVHTHAWDAGKVTSEATCKAEGVKTFTCACGETKTEKITKLTHKYDEGKVTSEATCKAEGVKTFTCSACGETKTEKITKLTHKYDEGKVTSEATCKAEGVKTFTCSACGETKTEKIAKLADHSWDAGSMQGTSFVYTCKACGETKTEALPKNIVVATIDKTDSWTLVIANVGASSNDRTGVRAAEGKICAGVYNKVGTKRTDEYEFDFASLGLEGQAWEYLGATIAIDVSDEENIKLAAKPKKSTFCVKLEDITFTDSKTAKLADGTTFNLSNINYGALRSNNLINEGGQYIPKWNDKTTVTSKESSLFTSSKFTSGYYVFVKVTIGTTSHDLVVDSANAF